MGKKISRRSFIKKTVMLGAASIAGERVFHAVAGSWERPVFASDEIDLSVAKGRDPFAATQKAVEQLGGMGRFVSRNSRVGLLVNWPFRNIGAHVRPDVVLALVGMCYEAGAKEICTLSPEFSGYWQTSTLSAKFQDEIRSLKPSSGNYVEQEIKQGKSLRKAQIIKDLLECDVFIDVPLTKDHEGCKFSGAMKNMMGLAPHSTCRIFHSGANGQARGYYDDVDHLSQCIADLNLIRRPDLCVSDSTEFITDKGPYGPGPMKKPDLVVASTDRVLIDSYCCRLLGLEPKGISMIIRAAQFGLGIMDLGKAKIREAAL